MLSTIVFLRHAETDLAGTFCGSTDPHLNQRGAAQLLPLLDQVADLHLDAIYTSDLLRARETAEALAARHETPIIIRPSLRQIDFGRWETLTWEQIEHADPGYAVRWVAEFPQLPPPGGESIFLFKHRVLVELNYLREQADGKTVAVVTHSTVLRLVLEDLGHLAPHHAWERTRGYTCNFRCNQQSPTGYLCFQL